MNENVVAYAEGMRYRIQVYNPGNAGMMGHAFAASLADAMRQRRAQREGGYDATVFLITPTGGLRFPGRG